MELQVKNIQGKDTGKKAKFSEEIFGYEPNDHAIYLDVKQFLANQRQGTHKAKERNEISGSTRKLKKQKGTGTARAGSIKSPVFRGGGRIFGPRPRDYHFKLNKKLKDVARKSALSYKFKEGSIMVVDTFALAQAKTKDYLKAIKDLKLENKKTLLVLADNNSNTYLSARNISKACVNTAETVCTYDIMNADTLIIEEGAIKIIEERLN